MDLITLTPPKDLPQAERVAMLLRTPGLAAGICEHVANGGSIIPLCKIWDVRYSQVVKWIRSSSPENNKAYDQALVDRSEWTKEKILTEIRILAEYDLRDLYDENGQMKPVKDWPEDVAKAITSVESVELLGKKAGEVKKLKTESRKAALELLGKTEAMFTEKVEHKADDSLAALIAKTFNRNEGEKK